MSWRQDITFIRNTPILWILLRPPAAKKSFHVQISLYFQCHFFFSFQRKRVPCGSLWKLTHFLVKYPSEMTWFIVRHTFLDLLKWSIMKLTWDVFRKNESCWLSRAECLSPLWLLLFLIPCKRHFRIIKKRYFGLWSKNTYQKGYITHAWQPLVKVKYTHSFFPKAIRSITT